MTAGRHIRRAGQDFSIGDIARPRRKTLNARDIGLIAAGNHPWVAVHRRPRVAILATGDEIALPGDPLPPGGIVSSNSHALAALVRACGGAPIVLPVAPDDTGAIATAADGRGRLRPAAHPGGASVGDHDLVQGAPDRAAAWTLDFWQIAMRPGKPLMHGQLGAACRCSDCPATPSPRLITAILFALPAIAPPHRPARQPPPVASASCAAPRSRANDHRADHCAPAFPPTRDDRPVVTAFSRQDPPCSACSAHPMR